MVRKIGNAYIFIFLLFFHFNCLGVVSISVDIQVLDEQGIPITQTGIGIPTILKVIVRGTSSQVDTVYIDGLKYFDVERRGTAKQLSTINGVTSIKTVYQYMIRAQNEGMYSIGPVHVSIDGTSYNSQSISLDVRRGYCPSSSATKKVALEVLVNKKIVVVGQKVPLRIRIYTNEECELLGIEPLELQHCKIGTMQGPFSGVDERHGIQRKYVEWQTAIIPQKTGEFIIPALKAYYKELMSKGGLHTDFFGGLFNFGYHKKYTYSNVVNIKVESLPKYEGKVHAIGSFTSLRAQLNQHEAKQGEGIVLSLELEGEGDFDNIVHPRLDVPESLTYYDSKATIVPSGIKKTFEYIVQGKQEGIWNVPSQDFVFFDVNDKIYKVLQTASLPITIVRGKRDEVSDIKTEKSEVDVAVTDKQNDFWLVNENCQQMISYQKRLPPYILFLCLVFPFIICLISGLCFLSHWHTTRDAVILKRKYVFTETKKKIKIAAKIHDTSALYDIFITLFADRYSVERSEISHDLIQQKLVYLSKATCTQWAIFFSKITEQAYANRYLTLQEQEELFKGALMWVTLFQKS